MERPWDYDNRICRECPVHPLIDADNQDVCDPCRAMVVLQLDIEAALDAANRVVEALLA